MRTNAEFFGVSRWSPTWSRITGLDVTTSVAIDVYLLLPFSPVDHEYGRVGRFPLLRPDHGRPAINLHGGVYGSEIRALKRLVHIGASCVVVRLGVPQGDPDEHVAGVVLIGITLW